MKKSIFMSLLAAVSLGMATVSCSSDNTEDGQGGSGKMETYTISCSFDKDTRMTLDAVASQYKWQDGDQITVWNEGGTKIATGTLTDGAGTKDGTFKFASSQTAKYVTFISGGTNGSVGSEGKQITIDPVQTYASTGTDISGLPIMAQGTLTEVTGKQHEYTTTLQHKMSFIKFGTITYNGSATDLTISGTKTATINPITGSVTSDATYTNSTIAAANVTSGKMIAVFPGCNFAAAVHDTSIANTSGIAANLIYTLDKAVTAAQTYEIEWQDGNGNSIKNETKTWGTNITAPAAVSLADHTFEGWAISTAPTTKVANASASCSDATFGKTGDYNNTKVVMVPVWHVYSMKFICAPIVRTYGGELPVGQITCRLTYNSSDCTMTYTASGKTYTYASGVDMVSSKISIVIVTTTNRNATFKGTVTNTYDSSATTWKGWIRSATTPIVGSALSMAYSYTAKISDCDNYLLTPSFDPY